jgi:hypothetical protein
MLLFANVQTALTDCRAKLGQLSYVCDERKGVLMGLAGLLQLDGLVSIGAHEIVEWITDPDGDAWWEHPHCPHLSHQPRSGSNFNSVTISDPLLGSSPAEYDT